jgi:hypothetical protein
VVRRRIHSKGKQIQIPLHGIPIKAVMSIQEILQPGMNFIDPIQRVVFVRRVL